jgi:SAM-dependent methyltransferase
MRTPTRWSGLRAAIHRYLYRRIRAAAIDGWEPFYEDAVTRAPDWPWFARELFLDVDLLERGLADIDARRSLEVGCGYGRLTPWIARYAAEHHGVDVESALVRRAARVNREAAFHRAHAQALPFQDDTFELTVAWAVLMHVPPYQIDRVTAEMRRVTAPGGTIVVSERIGRVGVGQPYVRSVDAYRRLFEPLEPTAVIDRPMEEPYWDIDHRHALLRFE